MRLLGDGVPVEWISNTEILGVANTFGVEIRPIILKLDGRRVKKLMATGQYVTWNGQSIIFGKARQMVEVFDKDLSHREKSLIVPQYENSKGLPTQSCFVGIPAADIDRFFVKKS